MTERRTPVLAATTRGFSRQTVEREVGRAVVHLLHALAEAVELQAELRSAFSVTRVP